jgi:CheY-like chemotaxis protein
MSAISGSIHVLHVDDEPDFAEMAAEFIRRRDERFDVETATSATEAIDRLRRNHIHCIVSDFDMPGRNGIEFLETVRERSPDLPFILFTGKGSEDIASEAISAGVTDYLQKESGTGQYDVLANRIVNAVENYRTQNELKRQNQAFDGFLDIVNDTSLSIDEQLTGVLDLGVDFLDLDIGIISRIDPPDYTVEHVVTPDGSIEQQAVLDFSDTFCELVYAADGPVAFHSPEAGGVEDHPCYQDLGLQAYLGEPLIVEEARYGTLNFSSPAVRDRPFTDGERAFIRTMGEWVSRELGNE